MTESSQNKISDNKQFIFSYKSILFSIRLGHVIEVIDSPEITPLPWNEKGLLGLLKYRGTPIPVVDPVDIGNVKVDSKTNSVIRSAVLIECKGYKIGLTVDRFYNILSDEFVQTEEEDESEERTFISGFSLIENQPLVLLNEVKITEYYKKLFQKQLVSKNQDIRDIAVSSNKGVIEKFIFFTIGEVNFGVPIKEILEVLENVDVTPLFKVVSTLRGVINVRGKVIPCIDISTYLGLVQRSLNENTRFVILQYEEKEIALCVDSVSKMKEVDNSQIQSNDGLLNGPISEYATGVLQLNKQTLLMISAKSLIYSRDLEPYIGREE